jgi:hypothetical protein
MELRAKQLVHNLLGLSLLTTWAKSLEEDNKGRVRRFESHSEF